MSAGAPSDDTIKESIKQYLLQFDGYAKAIQDIKDACKDIDSLENVSEKIKKLKVRQLALIKEINLDEFKMRTVLNEDIHAKKLEKELEKIIEHMQDHQLELVKISDNLKQKRKDEILVDGCKTTSPEMLKDIQRNYKMVFEKLSHARKVFPQIYARAEQETDIFIFTPFTG